MVEKKIEVEFLAAHGEPVLAAHKCEPDAEFEKKLAPVVEQATLQIALVGIVAQGEKIEVVGIFGEVPREVGLRLGQGAVEVCDAFPLTAQPPGFDLVNENVATPSVLNGRFGVPDAVFGSLDQIEDADVMAPLN